MKNFMKKSKKYKINGLIVFVSLTLVFSLSLSNSSGIAEDTDISKDLVKLSADYSPTILKGLTIYPNDPLKFDFIVDPGQSNIQGEELTNETTKLVKCFLASLTIPDPDLWVNLSPYEENRIIPTNFAQTEMGQDLLSQDYLLKQLTASLMYPEDELGKKFWKRVRKDVMEKYGDVDISMDSFNKVWIVPQKAVVYRNGNSAYVSESYLKVMLEEDFVALDNGLSEELRDAAPKTTRKIRKVNKITTEIVNELIIPILEKEINEGKNFAQLRQIYQSVILANWYKQVLKDSLLGQSYVGQNKITGIDDAELEMTEDVYRKYIETFRKGAYSYVREDYDEKTQSLVPRKYFSGGVIVAIEEVLETPIVGPSVGRVGSDSGAQKLTYFFSPVSQEQATEAAAAAMLTDLSKEVLEVSLKLFGPDSESNEYDQVLAAIGDSSIGQEIGPIMAGYAHVGPPTRDIELQRFQVFAQRIAVATDDNETIDSALALGQYIVNISLDLTQDRQEAINDAIDRGLAATQRGFIPKINLATADPSASFEAINQLALVQNQPIVAAGGITTIDEARQAKDSGARLIEGPFDASDVFLSEIRNFDLTLIAQIRDIIDAQRIVNTIGERNVLFEISPIDVQVIDQNIPNLLAQAQAINTQFPRIPIITVIQRSFDTVASQLIGQFGIAAVTDVADDSDINESVNQFDEIVAARLSIPVALTDFAADRTPTENIELALSRTNTLQSDDNDPANVGGIYFGDGEVLKIVDQDESGLPIYEKDQLIHFQANFVGILPIPTGTPVPFRIPLSSLMTPDSDMDAIARLQ